VDDSVFLLLTAGVAPKRGFEIGISFLTAKRRPCTCRPQYRSRGDAKHNSHNQMAQSDFPFMPSGSPAGIIRKREEASKGKCPTPPTDGPLASFHHLVPRGLLATRTLPHGVRRGISWLMIGKERVAFPSLPGKSLFQPEAKDQPGIGCCLPASASPVRPALSDGNRALIA
jgi:hypothetical protein